MSCSICDVELRLGQRCDLGWEESASPKPSCARCGAEAQCAGVWPFYYLGRYLGDQDWEHAFLRADGRAFVCPGCGWMHQIMFRPCGDGLRSDLFAGVEATLAARRELEKLAHDAGKAQEATSEQEVQRAEPGTATTDDRFLRNPSALDGQRGTGESFGEHDSSGTWSHGGEHGTDIGRIAGDFWRKLFGIGRGGSGN